MRLTLSQTKGNQIEAVTVPLPYGESELCPVRALVAVAGRCGYHGVVRLASRLVAWLAMPVCLITR